MLRMLVLLLAIRSRCRLGVRLGRTEVLRTARDGPRLRVCRTTVRLLSSGGAGGTGGTFCVKVPPRIGDVPSVRLHAL